MPSRCAPANTAVVRVTGEDAAAFLQGQCSADLRSVALADALWLNRKGRVLAHTVIVKEADGTHLLLGPHLSAEALIAIVTANVIADDVVATDESAPAGVQADGAPEHDCLLYTSPSPRDLSTSRMPSSA